MNSNSEIQPITNGEQQIHKNKDDQEPLTEGNSGEKGQINKHPPINLGTSTKNYKEKEKFGDKLKQVVRYVTIQVPPKNSKPDQEKVQNVKSTLIKKNRHPLNPIKVRLKPPRYEVHVENFFQEEILLDVEPQTVTVNNSSDNNTDSNHSSVKNCDSKLHSNYVLVGKKGFKDQETQTDIHSCLYNNGKLYSVVSDDNNQYVSNVVRVIQPKKPNLQNVNHKAKRKKTSLASRQKNSKKAVQKKVITATNTVVEEIVISDDSLSDGSLPDSDPVEIKRVGQSSVTSLINSKSARLEEETITLPDYSPSENIYSNLLVPRKSPNPQNESILNKDSNQFTKSQSVPMMYEVHDQTYSTISNNQTMFLNNSISTPESSNNLAPISLEMQHIPSYLDDGSHSRTSNTNEPTQTHLSGVFSKLIQEIKNCLVEDELGNIPLHQAVIDVDITQIKSQCILLKSMKYGLNHVNSRRETALVVAVKIMLFSNSRASFTAVEVLLNEGVDQTITDLQGYTPLHYAVKTGSVELTKLLLKSNQWEKVINKYGNDGLVPVHLAAIGNHEEIITQLVNKGCDINAEDRKSGRTPYFLALDSKSMDAAKTLIIHKAMTSTQNYAGHFPPHDDSQGIKKLIDLKDSVLKNPSDVDKYVKSYVGQVNDKKKRSVVKPPTVGSHGNNVESGVKINRRGNIKKARLPKQTNSLGNTNKSKPSQAVNDTVNSGSSTKFQKKDSSKQLIINCDKVVYQKNNEETFPNGINNSSIQSITNLVNHSQINIKEKNPQQIVMCEPDKRNANENMNSTSLDKSRTTSRNRNKLSLLRMHGNESSVLNSKDSVQTTSCTSFALDNSNVLEPCLTDSSVNAAGCTVVAIDYSNDSSNTKVTSSNSFILDNGNTLSYELAPSQKTVYNIAPNDLQLTQPDMHKDLSTNIESKANKKGNNKRKGTEMQLRNPTKKSKKK